MSNDSDYIITHGPAQYFNNQVYMYNDLIVTTNDLRGAKDIADRINTAIFKWENSLRYDIQ